MRLSGTRGAAVFYRFRKRGGFPMRWKFLILAGVLAAAAFGSAHPAIGAAPGGEILVSAAVSLKNAFEELGTAYQNRTGMRVRFNFAASGLLQKQIEAGAPVDVFASASAKQMDALEAQELMQPGSRRNFARNVLVLITPADSGLRSFADLARPGIARIAIGNPKTVPAGQYAAETLRHLKLWPMLQSRTVYAENVRQVLDYVVRGEADAGMVYASDVAVAAGRIRVAAHAPRGAHAAIVYPAAVVRGSANRAAAGSFMDLLLSPAGQAILAKHGFSGAK